MKSFVSSIFQTSLYEMFLSLLDQDEKPTNSIDFT